MGPSRPTRLDIGTFVDMEDPRDVPAYSISEVAHYLQIPYATLSSWVVGRRYKVKGGEATFAPIIHSPAAAIPRMLSFFNLVEAHVLDAIRHVHKVDLDAVRRAIRFIEERYGTDHPLARWRLETDGQDLFIRAVEGLLAPSAQGQLGMKQVLNAHLQRIERDAQGVAEGLYLFTRGGSHSADDPKVVLVNPALSFGRPVLAGTGIPTAVIAERFLAGESVEDLVEDYDRSSAEIQEALRCERTFSQAA